MPPINHRTECANVVHAGSTASDGDTDGDINPFWQDRNYFKDVAKVKAAVFESHGINDDNVRPDQMYRWWTGLPATTCRRSCGCRIEGHVDPFDYRRAAWVDTLHRWFDYWLQGVPNGIMNEPQRRHRAAAGQRLEDLLELADPEHDADRTSTCPATAPRTPARSRWPRAARPTRCPSRTRRPATSRPRPTDINTPNTVTASRLVFLSTKTKNDLHLSGQPIIDLHASLSTPQSNLAGFLVDYGPYSKVGRGGSDGVSNTDDPHLLGRQRHGRPGVREPRRHLHGDGHDRQRLLPRGHQGRSRPARQARRRGAFSAASWTPRTVTR